MRAAWTPTAGVPINENVTSDPGGQTPGAPSHSRETHTVLEKESREVMTR